MYKNDFKKYCPYDYVDVLLKAFELAGVVPKRKFKSKEEFIEHFPDIKFVIADGTERRKRRPKNKAIQKEFYSGKKNSLIKERLFEF